MNACPTSHAATHIVYRNGKQYIVCTHCGTTVGES
jgi:ribosomal protein S27E